MKLALIATLLLSLSCKAEKSYEDELIEKRRDLFDLTLQKTCVPDVGVWGALCKLSVNGKESCYIARGRSAFRVDCPIYNEMKKVLDGLDSE